MFRVKLLRPMTARLAGLAGMLALPLLAGCVYDDGYYSPPPSYGYDYGDDYGYGGYGSYGYGYGYGYGHYGNPCWPYGCDGWGHRRHHHHDNDDDNDNSHHHHHGGGIGMNDGPQFDPGKPHNHGGQANGGTQPRVWKQAPASPYWIPPGEKREGKP